VAKADLRTLTRYQHFILMGATPGPEGQSATRFARELEREHPNLPELLRQVEAAMRGEPQRESDGDDEDDDEDDDEYDGPVPAPVPNWISGIERVARAFGEGQAIRGGAGRLRPGQVDVKVRPDTQGEVSVLVRVRAADVLAGRVDFSEILGRVLRGFRKSAP
jgi:hypothetical protein